MKNNKSFTLLEILVVTTIIALIGTTGFNSYTTTTRNARDTRRKADLEYVKTAIATYQQIERVSLPLVENGWIDPIIVGSKKYLEKVPNDPMSGYVYRYTRTTPTTPFKVCTKLENSSNPVFSGLSCGTAAGLCNYCTTTTGEVEP